MKTSEVVKLLVEGIARHGDADLKVNGREVYTGERVPSDVPIVLVVGNSEIGSGEDEFGDLFGDSLGGEVETEVFDGYEEVL